MPGHPAYRSKHRNSFDGLAAFGQDALFLFCYVSFVYVVSDLELELLCQIAHDSK